uniref:TSA: Wollemia nobilis Ref_Wollemi_Transcript_1661_859 transcribed RNA sequence n=1 Tax=Wollemia nobilis TaxID=56998 RepID=A0A0C9RYZ6_9CONI
MAKIGALLFVCLVGLFVAQVSGKLVVKGSVYCDNCHCGFPTRVSPAIAGAKIAVRCNVKGEVQEHLYEEGVSNDKGEFEITVQGEHAQHNCHAVALSSPTTCNIATDSMEAPVFLTHNNGIVSDVRTTGPFAFKSAETHPECTAVMNEFNI